MKRKELSEKIKLRDAMIRHDYFLGILKDRKEIAEHYEVSIKTVSRALNKRIS